MAVVPEVDRALVQARCGAVPLRTVPADEDVRRGNARIVAELLVALDEEPDVHDELLQHLVEVYPELPGRFQAIGGAEGPVRWIDDALASNAAALVAALHRAHHEHADRPLHLIAGGRDDRGVATEAVVAEVRRAAPRSVLCLDEFGGRLAADLRAAGLDRAGIEVLEVVSLEAAVDAALVRAGGRDATILFSPGAPTPHEQGSWKDRSRRFARAAQVEEVH
ncbi:hypothetical protein B7486_60215 [cyanobacterium TDX16]|nr:hypothetical protein B7486_60215 [cyanobacterium TDX16]